MGALLATLGVLAVAHCDSTTVMPAAEDGGATSDLASPSPDLAGVQIDMAGPSPDFATMPGADPEPDPKLKGITALHNQARASVNPQPAVAIPPLTWSNTVAATAQAWANKCMFVHNPSSGYGENIYATSGSNVTASMPVNNWVNEKSSYNYNANTCSGTCGHYTQVVWRSSLRLGCAQKTCTTNSPFGASFPTWTFVVCNYDPPGNSGGRPY